MYPNTQYPQQSRDILWQQDYYILQQKLVSMGRKFYIQDKFEDQIGFCQGTLLKLKDEFRVYRDETKTEELLFIKQEQIFDVWGTFGIHDSKTGETIGYVSRKFAKSFIRDEWILHDSYQNDIGLIQEDSPGMAILRRIISIIPKKMHIDINGQRLVHLKRKFITIGKWWIDCRYDPRRTIDRRLILSAAILMEAVEQGHKTSWGI